MTAISRWRPTIGLAIVIAPYWVPILVGLKWGVWSGGDAVELATSASRHMAQDWAGIPLETPFLAPFVLVSLAWAFVTLARHRATTAPEVRRIDLATVIIGTPYIALGAWYLGVLVLFLIACALQPCSFIF